MNRILTILIALFCIVSQIKTQEQQFTFPEFSQVELTKSDVDKFIDKFPSMKADFEKLDQFHNDGGDMKTYMEAIQANSEANRIAKKHGYDDMTDFVNTTWTIATSYAAYKLTNEAAPGVQDAINQIEANEYMSAEEKAAAIEQMKMIFSGAQQSITHLSNEKNIAVVADYAEKLEFVFDEE